MTGLSPGSVAELFREACRAELQALKPGNVHVHGEAHGMTVADFLASADAAAPPLAAPGAAVGARILGAVAATRAAVGQNTNLGIVLLCAPLAAAADTGGELRASLARVLAGLDHPDAVLAYKAIRLAAPGGLGRSSRHDVADEPCVTLLDAMRSVARRDRIARQYASGFRDVFDLGVPRLLACRAGGWPEPWALAAAYLTLLAAFPDTHIVRRHGQSVARAVQEEARGFNERMSQVRLPDAFESDLHNFDRRLKERRINPGTSADLTVATHFAAGLAGAAGRS